MAKSDVLKTYSIVINASTEAASAEVDKLSKELDKKIAEKDLDTGLRQSFDKVKKSLDGLKGSIKSANKEINKNVASINTQLSNLDVSKVATQIADMEKSISGSLKNVTTELDGLKTFFENPNLGKNFSSGIGSAFKELTDTVNNSVLELKNASTTLSGILDGSIDISKLTPKNNSFKKSTKDLSSYVDSLDFLIDKIKKSKSEFSLGKKNSLDLLNVEQLKELRGTIDVIRKEFESLGKTAKAEQIISETLKISSADLNSFYKQISNKIKAADKEKSSGVKINLTYDITNDDEKAINGIVSKIKNEVITKVQEKLNSTPIKIPIGYTYDRDILKGDKIEEDRALKDGTSKTILRHINLDVKANTSDIVGQINAEVDGINKRLKTEGKKIEVEVIGKINPNTIVQSSNVIAEKIEDAQYHGMNGININGGQIAIDPSNGIATENTLASIRDIISGWNKSGIPGTQTKEFKQKLQTEKQNQAYYSGLDTRLRIKRQSSVLTKREQELKNTEDYLLASVKLRTEAISEINKLARNKKLRDGDRTVFTNSDFYNKSFTFNGEEYAQYGNGEKISEWKAKWDKILESTFGTYDENIGKLYDITEQINGKNKTIKKGLLRQTREQLNKQNKSSRESLSTLGIEFQKTGSGSYNYENILAERQTITSIEDAYVKVQNVVNNIKTAASQEHQVLTEQIQALENQKVIMEEIYSLEQKSKNTTLLPEEQLKLELLKNQLNEDVKIVTNTSKLNNLLKEQSNLKEKIRKKQPLTVKEHDRYLQLNNEINSLFTNVDNISEFVAKQIQKDAETGMSAIDQQIKHLKKSRKDLETGVYKEIGMIYQPVNDINGIKELPDRYRYSTESRNLRLNVPIKSDKEYQWSLKELEKLRTENAYLGRLITTKYNAKGDSYFDTSAMTDYEKARYFDNKRYIEILRTRNMIYEEQKGLISDLTQGYNGLNKSYKNEALQLEGNSDAQLKQILKHRASFSGNKINDKAYFASLTDNELNSVFKVVDEISKKTEKTLSDNKIRGLVQSRIQEDIDFYKAQLKEQEDLLARMESGKIKASTSDQRKAAKKISGLNNTISALENPVQQENKQLTEQRKILQDINKEKEGFINKLRSSINLSEEEIQDGIKLLALKKQQKEAEQDLSNANVSAYNYYKNQQKNSKKETETLYSTAGKTDSMYSFGYYTEIFDDNVLAKVKRLNSINHELKEHESTLKVLNPQLLEIMNNNIDLTVAELRHWDEIESKRNQTIDKIFKIKAKQSGLSGKQYRSLVLGGKEFDPFDTTGEDYSSIYEKRVQALTALIKQENSVSNIGTAKQLLKIVQEELAYRERVRKEYEAQQVAAKNSYKEEKANLTEKRKSLDISDKAYKQKQAELELLYEQKKIEQGIDSARLAGLKDEKRLLKEKSSKTDINSDTSKNINNRISEINQILDNSKTKLEILEKEKKVELDNLEIKKQIRNFEKGMSAKQKNASFAVDSKLLEIQALQKQRDLVPKASNDYEILTKKIIEAKIHLGWFREEAESLGLTLSETTGRMYLNPDNKNIKIKDLNYTGLIKPGGKDNVYDFSESIQMQKAFEKARLAEYHYHSQVVEDYKEQTKLNKRLTDMSRIAGMNDREAELALEVQKVNAQLQNKENLTKKQTKALEEQLQKLYAVIDAENKLGKINLTIGKNGYVDAKVSRSEFVENQEQYASSNRYIQAMLNNSDLTLSQVKNAQPTIENYRLATENTLQNIQKILMQGVKVKPVAKNYKLDYGKYYGGLNPKLSLDSDASNPIVGSWFKEKEKTKPKKKSTFVYDPTKAHNYEQMDDDQKLILERFAELKNLIIKEGSTKELKNQLAGLYKEAKGVGLSVSRKGNLYLADPKENSSKKSGGEPTQIEQVLQATIETANKLSQKVDEIEQKTIKKPEEIAKIETKSSQEVVKSEQEKKDAIDQTTASYITQGKSIDELKKDYKNSLRYKDSKNKKTSDKWTNVYNETSKALTDKGLKLVDGNWIKQQTDGIKEINNAENKSANVVENTENKKQKSIKKTKEEIDYATASVNELIDAYNKSDAILKRSNLKKETRDFYISQKSNSQNVLEKLGYTLIDGKWNNNKYDPTNIDFAKLLNLEDVKNMISVAETSISQGTSQAEAWKAVLPELKNRLEEIILKQNEAKQSAIDYANSFGEPFDFANEQLRKLGINIGTLKGANKINDKTYSFVGEYGEGQITLGEDGQWMVNPSVTKEINNKAKVVENLKSSIRKLSGVKFENLAKANPNLFFNSSQIEDAKLKLQELYKFLETGYTKDTDIEKLKRNLLEVKNIANSLKGGLKLNESEIVGKIDTNNISQVRTELIKMAKSVSDGSIEIGKFNARKKELVYTTRTADNVLQTYTISMNQYTGEVTNALVAEQKYATGFQKLLSGLGRKFNELIRYSMASFSLYRIFGYIKSGINIVKEMDKAMTELRKVSNDTTKELEAFRKESFKIANTIGSTGKEIVNSAADWEKLGYSIKEASELAKNSALYANVGDMEINVATEHMVSALKAFNVEASNSISLVDKMNYVGNRYAITSAGIGEALERSASSLVAAGNNIDESIALITAGNTVSQDPESVGNAIKVLSLRIRGSKTELEEMDEETDNLASSTSKLRKEIKALTGVDIMLNDEEYKSTYQILLEISKVWENLTDVSQANVLEKLAGKTRASVVAGLLQNGETLEKVLHDSMNSEGSAVEENKRYMESIQGHLDILTNKWQELWDTGVDKDLIKFFIDFGSSVLDVANNLGLLKTALIGMAGISGFKSGLKNDGKPKCMVFI